MLIIGSTALNFHAGNIIRVPKDYDAIATIDEYNAEVRRMRSNGTLLSAEPFNDHKYVIRSTSGAYFEVEIAWPGTSGEDLLTIQPHGYADLNTQLMLKLSHRYLRNSPHFHKTRQDVALLQLLGAKLTPELKTILKKRERETYTYAHPNLNQDKRQFFDDSVPYVHEHDDIHLAVAVGPRPAYQEFAKDGEEVKSDRKKFRALPREVQLRAGLEESYVLAIERSLVPFPHVAPRRAFDIALMKVCTSITSGWFREFCWTNHDDIAALYDESFVTKFNAALAAGRIRPFQRAMAA